MVDRNFADFDALLKCDPVAGKLFWKSRPRSSFPSEASWRTWNTRYAGKEALASQSPTGYCTGTLFGKTQKAHRVVWLLHYGSWPESELDHINGVRSDNRIENLRAVSHAENQRNMRRPSTNTSGVVGVCWAKREGKWKAQIKRAGKNIDVGYFASFDDAVAARKFAEAKLGFHLNHGSSPLPSQEIDARR